MKGTVPYLVWRNRIEKHTPAGDRIGDDLLLVRQSGYDTGFITGPFRLDMTIAVFLQAGHCRVMIDMTAYTAVAPCMIIVMVGHIFQFVDMTDDMQSLTLLMSERFSASLFGEYGQTMHLTQSIVRMPVVDLSDDKEVFNTYLVLLQDLVRSPLKEFKLEAARHLTLAMFYGYSYHLHAAEKAGAVTKPEQLYRQFELELQRHHMQERGVAFYASLLCVTPKYLSAVVRKQSGRTAQQCIDEYVVTECKALLLSTDMSVQQIADRMNFPSQSVFGKYFKRVTGVSPRMFRNEAS